MSGERAWQSESASAGIVVVGVAGLRRKPDHASEQVTQALLGETFRVEDRTRDGDWLAVRLDTDGYRGWLRAWYAVTVDGREAERWGRAAGGRVARREVRIREAPRPTARVAAVAPWQARLSVLGRVGEWTEVGLPDGGRGFVPRAAIAEGPTPGGPPSARRLLRTAARMAGTPYVWGGRSAWGYDCSGFVQAVLAWHGLGLPRDSGSQFGALSAGRDGGGAGGAHKARARGRGAPDLDVRALRPGDLLFFGTSPAEVTHVALGVGRGDFLHAYGQVTDGSLDESSERYVPQLLISFLLALPIPGMGGG